MLRQVLKSLLQDKLWRISALLLLLANLAYFIHNPIGWGITLGFFLFAPGYLIFKAIRHNIHLRWEILTFSLGLSLLFLMIVGLALNSLHYIGLNRPFTTINIFIALDIGVALLIYLNRRATFHIPKVPTRPKHIYFAIGILILPLLAIGGAIRLNNGASNILTMILFALIAATFLFLVWRKDLEYLYPYALFVMALSVLLTVSLRGWGITGHDIQREFYVFQLAMQQEFWDIKAFPDPYNACLSITILPVMLAKITHISDPYIYKVVFQVIFAFTIVPIYFFMKRLRDGRIALMGAFLFISFPTFINDMPMLNRQEIGFLFFSLLMLLALTDMPRKQKKFLTVLFLLGAILSHYSSSYIVLGVLLGSWITYLLISKILKNTDKERLTLIFPTLNIMIIITALLFVFLWNSQITGTTAGLQKTTTKTVEGLFGKSGAQSADVGYSLIAKKQQSPQTLLNEYVKKTPGDTVPVTYVATEKMPITSTGNILGKIINADTFNTLVRNFSAKFIQIMLFLGCIVLFFTYRKKNLSQKDTYFLALIITCVAFMAVQTLLPQLSVDYGTLRLFQQLLIILAIPTIIGILSLAFLFKNIAVPFASIVLAFLFLHLSGFIPQITGGYPPQLALNNAGFYYDAYYIESSEKKAASWLVENNKTNVAVAVDPYARLRFQIQDRDNIVITSPFTDSNKAYAYKSRVNKSTDSYLININSNLYHYKVLRQRSSENCLYNSGTSEVCKLVSEHQ